MHVTQYVISSFNYIVNRRRTIAFMNTFWAILFLYLTPLLAQNVANNGVQYQYSVAQRLLIRARGVTGRRQGGKCLNVNIQITRNGGKCLNLYFKISKIKKKYICKTMIFLDDYSHWFISVNQRHFENNAHFCCSLQHTEWAVLPWISLQPFPTSQLQYSLLNRNSTDDVTVN